MSYQDSLLMERLSNYYNFERHSNDKKQLVRLGVYNTQGADVSASFVRDSASLINQYWPLIYSTYQKYAKFYHTVPDLNELGEAVLDIFVSLVSEYDTTGEVDFPGYIKTMLGWRVGKSYSQSQDIRKKNENVLSNNNLYASVERLIDTQLEDGTKVEYQYRYNDSDSLSKGKSDKVRGKVSRITSPTEVDTSLTDLLDEITTLRPLSSIQVALINSFINKDQGVIVTKEEVADKYHLSMSQVQLEYQDLRERLLEAKHGKVFM